MSLYISLLPGAAYLFVGALTSQSSPSAPLPRSTPTDKPTTGSNRCFSLWTGGKADPEQVVSNGMSLKRGKKKKGREVGRVEM
jgi:hypothetical protein